MNRAKKNFRRGGRPPRRTGEGWSEKKAAFADLLSLKICRERKKKELWRIWTENGFYRCKRTGSVRLNRTGSLGFLLLVPQTLDLARSIQRSSRVWMIQDPFTLGLDFCYYFLLIFLLFTTLFLAKYTFACLKSLWKIPRKFL